MKKIGIMGGTFNPVHYGHLALAENAYDSCQLDEVWFIPSSDPPHKMNMEILDYKYRSRMTELAVAEVPYFLKYDFEDKRDAPSYTSETLRLLKKGYPEMEFYFIMGADSLFQLETWHEPESVMAQAGIIVAVRDHHSIEEMQKQIDYLTEKYGARIQLTDMPGTDVSSALIRKRVKEHRTIRFLVPEKVREYIEGHNLYTERAECK